MDDYDHADPDRSGQLHHVELYADEFETARAFWGWWLSSLGYDQKNVWESGVSWINGPTYIVLVDTDVSRPPFDRDAPGLNHLAFHTDSQETVDKLTAGVRERADTRVLFEDQHPYAGGYYALYCESPQGVKLEAIAPEDS